MSSLPSHAVVVVEVPRGSFVKRGGDGRVDFVSPLPAPFDYGAVPDTVAPDGEEQDALLLDTRLSRGDRVRARVLGVVRFVDAGVVDDKWVCGERATEADVRRIARFFRLYALAKRWMNRLRGRSGRTAFDGCEWR